MAEDPFKKTSKQAAVSEGYAAYHAQEKAKLENMLRLRKERLAREAANPPDAKPAAEPKKRKRIIRK